MRRSTSSRPSPLVKDWCSVRSQRSIARKIIDKKADYVLALNGNQGTLRDDVELFVAEQKANNFKDTTISQHETVDGDHGRIETRRTGSVANFD